MGLDQSKSWVFNKLFFCLGRGSKKKVVILLQPKLVDGRIITPNLSFFMVPSHPNLQRIFFVGRGSGGVGPYYSASTRQLLCPTQTIIFM